ncbi:MAG: long-chain fatty acid--CoA ligase [Polyangiaceae bacterium]|jgi:long-chain acyl-CoA synthetase
MLWEPRFKTLVDLFRTSVDAFANRPLFGSKKAGSWTWLTYGDFARQVDGLRAGLASIGIERGDRVAIIANNRVEWAVAAYACFGLGAAWVPMYEAQSPKEWEFIVRDCEAKAIVVANEVAFAAARGWLQGGALRHVIALDGAAADGVDQGSFHRYGALVNSAATTPSREPVGDDLAALLYTSGTTGTPKGVMLSHLNIASNVSSIRESYPFGPDDLSLAFLPWAHAFGQTAELHHMIAAGASMAICEGNDKILENLAEIRPTVIFAVPRIFNRIYTAVQQQLAARPKVVRRLVAAAFRIRGRERAGQSIRWHDRVLLDLVDRLVASKVRARFGGRLKCAVSGGAALSHEVGEFIDSLGIVVYEGYGLTETSPVAAVNLPGARKMGSVGRALLGVRVSTLDDGELVVYGPNVMKGYFKRPEETAAVLTPDHGFRTGDLATIDAEGFVFITGRIKEQYKLENGKYVVPTPLEEQLKLSPFVSNAMVFGDNRPYNVALIVPNILAIQKWAEERHLPLPKDPSALIADSRVRELVGGEVEKHNALFKGFESVRDFELLAEDFTTENGMLTPKLSLKRGKVIENYAPLLDRMYEKRGDKRSRASAA